MSTETTRQHYKFVRRARNLGVSALIAATIGGYTLYQRSAVNADSLTVLPTSALVAPAQATAEATADGLYKDGQYTGISASASHWGNLQLTVVIANGQITDFKFNDYPHSTSTSLRISQVAIPYLMQEAIQAQTASIDVISRATLTSEAFMQSLQSALDQAATGATVTPTPAPTLNSSGSTI